MSIKIYTLPSCPHCVLVKNLLKSTGIPFEELNMEDADCMTNLIMDGVYVREAPVLFINGTYYTHDQIFENDEIRDKIIYDVANSVNNEQ